MKIMNIIKEEEDIQNKLGEFIELLQKVYDSVRYKKDITYSTGSGYVMYDKEPNGNGVSFEIALTYFPDKTNPVIPVNIFKVASDKFISDLCEYSNLNKMELIGRYRDVLNEFSLTFSNCSIFYGEGIIHLKMYMDNNVHSVRVEGHQQIMDVLTNENIYLFTEDELPKYSRDYPQAMDKIIKKCKTIYSALGSGTWKGHTYTYGKFNKQHLVVHQKLGRFNKRDKILYPDFEVSFNPGFGYIDDVYNNIGNSPLMEDEEKEFKEWLEKKFKHFGINFRA